MDTFQALAVALVAILPGAIYVWAYERGAGSWGISSPDRIYRFVAASAVFQVVFAPVTYWLWKKFIHSGKVSGGQSLPLWLWVVVILYAVIPLVAGWFVGDNVQQRTRLGRIFRSPTAPPKAWDYLFSSRPQGLVRIKLKSGAWIAGVYADLEHEGHSYASAFPSDQDVWLPRVVAIDPATGEYPPGPPELLPEGLLIDWEQVDFLLFDWTR